MPNYALDITSLSKSYKTKGGSLQALKSVSLKVEEGSIFGLLGPNGAGKSTLINILATSVIKSSGSIKICDVDFDTNQKACKSLLGIVPQEIIIDPYFTVREALEIYAGFYGVRPEHRITDELLEKLGLADKANVKPRSLSGGMKRRLLVAKALVHKPKVLILDEPTAGVDVELRTQLWDYVRELNKSGTTIILTTHYLEEAEELCDDIAVINHGEVIARDKTENLIKIFGERQLTIVSNKITDVVLKKLDALNIDFVITREPSRAELKIKYKHGNFELGKILNFCYENKVNVLDIYTKESDLEDIFKLLVKG